MTTNIPINHKRSSSNMNLQSFEPPMKKASFTSLPPSENYDANRASALSVKKVFTRVPMGDFLAKCGLISRGQQVFEDIFINEDKIYVPPMPKSCNASFNTRTNCSSCSLDGSFSCYCDGMDKSSGMKSQMNAKCFQKQQQQSLLETCAREESSESSIIGDEEDQIQGDHKYNFLTELIDPSAQIIVQACEIVQPTEDYNNEEDNEESFEFKFLELGSCN